MTSSNPGVRCPQCGCPHCPAYDTRRRGKWTVRKRRCRACGRELQTREQVIEPADVARNQACPPPGN